jgi:hypothetical protein
VLVALVATKREGLLLAVCLALGALAGSLRSWRRVWPGVLAATAGAYLVDLPWQFWWQAHNEPSDLPGGGMQGLLDHLSRIWPSLELVLRLQFSSGMWLLLAPLALAAGAGCLTLGGSARETAVLYLTTVAFALAGFTWILWSDPSLVLDEQQSSTPIPRVVGSIVLLSAVLAPILIEPLLRGLGRSASAPPGEP